MLDPAPPTVPVPTDELEARIAAIPALGPDTELAGRYRIVKFLARGGMGAVYEAFDRELGVTVALKTVRPDIPWGAAAVDRFKREIQLARVVTHPGVCRIFDLGKHGDVVFLTMELLVGTTLSQRLAAGPIDARERHSIALQICDALEAAHAAGVVHRDLKPGNVMLCPQRGATRVVITDFGVARQIASTVEVHDLAAEAGTAPRDLGATNLAGTPAYMAPEQLAGEAVSPATDLFALGVVMFEIATGELPWPAEPDGARRPSPDRLATLARLAGPRWTRAVERCLAPRAGDRFRSASSLAAALGPGRRRWPIAAAGTAIALLAVGGVVIASRGAATDPCAARTERHAATTSPTHRAAIDRAFGANTSGAARLRRALDLHAARWDELDRAVCRDRDAGRTSSTELAARERCLDRGLVVVRALERQLGSTSAPLDADTGGAAIRVAESLPSLDACSGRGVTANRALAAPIDRALDDQMGEIEVVIDLARYGDAVKLAERLEQQLASSTDEYRRARASFLLARARIEHGELVGAEAPLRESIRLAARVGDDTLLAQCWVNLIKLLTQLGRMREALTIANVAEAAVVRAGSEPRLAFGLQINLSFAEGWEDSYARAIDRAHEAIAAAEQTFGSRDPDVIVAKLAVAEMQLEAGDTDGGEALATSAKLAAEQAFGAADFRVALGGYVVGLARRDRGDFAAGRTLLERAVADAAVLDEHHPGRFQVQAELGRLYLLAGETTRALALFERALVSARALHGPDGVRIGIALGHLGTTHLVLGDLAAAERFWTEALDERQRARGNDSHSASVARLALGLVLHKRGDRAGAIAHLERALAVLASSEIVAYGAIVRARLGRILWERPDTRPRALELAKLAKPNLRASPGDLVVDLPELTRFVAEACPECP